MRGGYACALSQYRVRVRVRVKVGVRVKIRVIACKLMEKSEFK